MLFREFIDINTLLERGKRITNEDMYNHYGNIKVVSSKIDGAFGYVSSDYLEQNNKANQKINEDTFIYSIEGNAGFISLYKPQRIWLSDVSGLFDVKKVYVDKYGKLLISVFLQNFFVNNRHNNGTQPKFLIKNVLNKEIDLSILDKLNGMDLSDVDIEEAIYKDVKKHYIDFNEINEKNVIQFKNLINGYMERGKRLVKGRELYNDYGEIKAISSTTTGPMGYYNKSNYALKDNDILYSIDGANAGYVSLLKPQEVFITDHAGVISIKKEYIKKYGKLAIALFLQDYFVKQSSNGTQPTFLLKNNLNLELDLNKLEVLSKMDLDRYI